MLICVGPGHGVITGQSMCLKRIHQSYGNACLVSNGGERISLIKKLYLCLYSTIKMFYLAILYRKSKVIFSVSRTRIGFIKDLPVFTICHILRLNVYLHIHGNDLADLIGRDDSKLSMLARLIYSKCTLAIVPNEFMSRQLEAVHSLPIKVLPNFHDLKPINPSSVLAKDKKRVLFLSSIMREKGIFDVFDAFNHLSHISGSVELHIAGPMLLDSQDNILFSRMMSNEKCYYHGVVTGEDKSQLLASSDVLVLPSKYRTEASPLVILEAMASNMAVLVYSHNNIEGVVPDKVSDLQVVDAYDFQNFTSKLSTLLETPKALSLCKRENLLESRKYTLERYIYGIKNILEES